jgi:hypothetical protein
MRRLVSKLPKVSSILYLQITKFKSYSNTSISSTNSKTRMNSIISWLLCSRRYKNRMQLSKVSTSCSWKISSNSNSNWQLHMSSVLERMLRRKSTSSTHTSRKDSNMWLNSLAKKWVTLLHKYPMKASGWMNLTMALRSSLSDMYYKCDIESEDNFYRYEKTNRARQQYHQLQF